MQTVAIGKTADFVARLRAIAMKCKFLNFDSSMLDQFIMGIVNTDAQELLLEEDFQNLTLEKAFKKVIAMDRSKQEVQMINKLANQQTVHKVSRTNKKFNEKPSAGSSHRELSCKKCKLKSHATKDCYRTPLGRC